MIKIVEIPKAELEQYILLSYRGDQELLDQYHVEKLSLIEAVKSTMSMVYESEKQLMLSYFKVLFVNEPIGYVITSGNHLYSFAINIEYRTKGVLNEWWDKVQEMLGETFTCLLFSNNTRAINYLEKRGMKITWQNDEEKQLKEVLLTN